MNYSTTDLFSYSFPHILSHNLPSLGPSNLQHGVSHLQFFCTFYNIIVYTILLLLVYVSVTEWFEYA